MVDFDVIIVGLGPAGAAAAVDLARAGAEVLVLDGSGSRGKPCGGCISLRGRRALEPFGPPDDLWRHPVSTLWLTGPGREAGCYPTAEPGCYLVDRRSLDAFLANCAQEAGARVLAAKAGSVVSLGDRFMVHGGGESFRGHWLLGADGANSLVGRSLGLGGTAYKYVALVEERPLPRCLAGPVGEAAVLELGGIRGGYGWLFGRGDTLNMGMAGWRQGLEASGGLKRCYARFLHRHGLEPGAAPRGAVIPCPDGLSTPRTRGRAMVVGDAAALADPFLGEGIAQAIVSGRQAAAAILADDPGLYQRLLGRTLLRDHGHARRVGRLIYKHPGLALSAAARHPGGIELGWMILRGELAPGELWGAVPRGMLGVPPVLDPNASTYYSYPLSG